MSKFSINIEVEEHGDLVEIKVYSITEAGKKIGAMVCVKPNEVDGHIIQLAYNVLKLKRKRDWLNSVADDESYKKIVQKDIPVYENLSAEVYDPETNTLRVESYMHYFKLRAESK